MEMTSQLSIYLPSSLLNSDELDLKVRDMKVWFLKGVNVCIFQPAYRV